ncbi:ras GEF [Macrolepiota fuliginosa MF-IS2]|uniref:Ras GEF n=1 Tax=Macrolepiota fuliginosa MF-IS2 TaxID=1400762 RepID=A0A9P6C3I6_9AGAR|nr:ras GEF [Macrolepiota fuliginosa MF-IS2]
MFVWCHQWKSVDGSFVDTSSGSAARGFKKMLDQQYGVNVQVRSPYAITGFINQHGQERYRVGLRDQMAPAASARSMEDPASSRNTISKASTDSHSPNQKRRSLMSMHFLPAFKNGSVSSRPYTTVTQGSGSRRMRKTRSIPDLTEFGEGLHRPQPKINTSGRTHSQSVTSVDAPRYLQNIQTNYPLPRRGDIFGQVMDWCDPLVPPTGHSPQNLSMNGSQATFDNRPNTQSPFGSGVAFDSPSLERTFGFLPSPRQLHEKHSFESTQTARQVDTHLPPNRDSAISLTALGHEPTRPASALKLYPSVSDVKLPPEEQDEAYTLSLETMTLTQYSTRVFDVLQTYRGLPQLDRFSPETVGTTVIKLSLSADDTAAPRDDPRFVIWGEPHPDWDHDDHSVSRDSFTDISTTASSLSKRRSKVKGRQSDASRISTKGSPAPKVLLAATIERWIAQLTSDLNYDELLNFFLTYRTYVSAIDLCQLLICRFHWALQKPISPEDEKVRRIVRVRTFVAIRYWLLTFFTVDFLPNRELRILITKWLNALLKDPVLKKNSDGLGIVKRLIKVAKECKQAHTQISSPKSKPEKSVQPQDHVLGKKFAEIVTKKAMEEAEDSDLDLDFLPEEGRAPESSGNDIANANIVVATNITSGISPNRPTPLPISSLNILHRTDHAPGPSSNNDAVPTPLPILPIHQSALSRAFVKTIGRLGRWTRVLNSRSLNRSPISACADVSAFDLDLNVSKDLLSINGGVETYLQAAEARRQGLLARPSQTILPGPTPLLSPPSQPKSLAPLPQTKTSPRASSEQLAEDAATPVLSHFVPSALTAPASDTPAVPPSPDYTEATHDSTPQPAEALEINQAELDDATSVQVDAESDTMESRERPISLQTTSTASFGIPLSELGQAPTFPSLGGSRWHFEVASLDDLDLSDSSSEANVPGPSAPPGLRKAPRKLPLRREFEFVQRPETVSSLGIISRSSVVSGPSSSSMSSASLQGLGGNIQQWQMNALVDSLSDDGEIGDAEAALRRLEGHINTERQQEKTSKVNGWVRVIQERMANGDYEDEEPRFPGDSDEEGDNSTSINGSASQVDLSLPTPPTSGPNESHLYEKFDESSANTPVSEQLPQHIPLPPGLDPPSSPTTTESKPSPEDVVPLEILQSRMPISPVSQSELDVETPISKFGSSIPPRVHRSFILGIRAEVLAQHFSMIDRELFMGVKFEELVLDDWAGTEEIDILDWTVYLKDRARFKAEHRFPEKTSALAAVRARFNLTANFVISEIVLTSPTERPMIVGKFVRTAWKCYGQSNFHTLTAIIAALESGWVTRAMRKSAWNRIGIFETRVLRDLKQFTSSVDNFKFIRQATDAIAESKPMETSTASVVSGGAEGKGKHAERPQVPTACIPFIGVYLSQLHRLGKLPDLIDPTAPHQTVGVNPSTNAFDPLFQPDIFSSLAPLPDSMNLEPLINVHKQRRIAEVIKSLVAGQHLASRVQYEVDKKIFNRCLRLRALDGPMLQRVLAMYSD